jgi:hypothetical protein
MSPSTSSVATTCHSINEVAISSCLCLVLAGVGPAALQRRLSRLTGGRLSSSGLFPPPPGLREARPNFYSLQRPGGEESFLRIPVSFRRWLGVLPAVSLWGKIRGPPTVRRRRGRGLRAIQPKEQRRCGCHLRSAHLTYTDRDALWLPYSDVFISQKSSF